MYHWGSSVQCHFLKNHTDFLIPSPLFRACEGLGLDAEEPVLFQSLSSAQGNGHGREVLVFMEGEAAWIEGGSTGCTSSETQPFQPFHNQCLTW